MRKVALSALLSLLLSFVPSAAQAQRSVWGLASHSIFKVMFDAADGTHVGTGFCAPGKVSLVVAAAHVVEAPPTDIYIEDVAGARHEMVVMGYDKKKDLATILLKDGACSASGLEWGDTAVPGDQVSTVGYGGGRPLPLLTQGIVSGVKGTFEEESPNGVPVQLGSLLGHSGSPVFNARNQVVGMVVGIFTAGDHINVMIPVDELRKFVK